MQKSVFENSIQALFHLGFCDHGKDDGNYFLIRAPFRRALSRAMMMKISLCLTCSDSTRLPGPYMVEKWQNFDDTVSMQIFVFTFKHIEYPIKVQGFGILLTLFLWPLYIYSCCVVIIYGAFSAHFHLTAFINSEILRSISTALTSVWVCIHGPGRAKLVLLWKPSGFCFPILISCPKATLVMSYALATVPSSYS